MSEATRFLFKYKNFLTVTGGSLGIITALITIWITFSFPTIATSSDVSDIKQSISGLANDFYQNRRYYLGREEIELRMQLQQNTNSDVEKLLRQQLDFVQAERKKVEAQIKKIENNL